MFVDEASGTYAGQGCKSPHLHHKGIWGHRKEVPFYGRYPFDGGELGSTGAESKWRQTD